MDRHQLSPKGARRYIQLYRAVQTLGTQLTYFSEQLMKVQRQITGRLITATTTGRNEITINYLLFYPFKLGTPELSLKLKNITDLKLIHTGIPALRVALIFSPVA
jgi:hypothetical protein